MRSVFRLAVILGLLALGGCGTGTYDQLCKTRLDQMRAAQQFEMLYRYPLQVPESRISFRVPGWSTTPERQFKAFTAKSGHPENKAERIAEHRVFPGFKVPDGWHRLTLEAMVPVKDENDQQKMPINCYVYQIDAADPGFKSVAAVFGNAIAGGGAKDWQPVEVATPEAVSVAWKRLKAEAKLPVMYKEPSMDLVTVHDELTICDAWLFEDQTVQVVLLWRYPKALSERLQSGMTDIEKMSTLCAGTVVLAPL